MTTPNRAPERITLYRYGSKWKTTPGGIENYASQPGAEVEYVRADIHEAALTAMKEVQLRAAEMSEMRLAAIQRTTLSNVIAPLDDFLRERP